MPLLPGVYSATKKDGTPYYRASITYRNKHISLGSYSTEEEAHLAYKEASMLIASPEVTIDDYSTEKSALALVKWVSLINFRDHGMYFKTPIYLKEKYFLYYLSMNKILKFDVDDLFFYSTHTIMQRGGYLFVADYGMQVNIQSRYGIKNFAVKGKDFLFKNGDDCDYRYGNIEIINHYHGVTRISHGFLYESKIHLNGDYIIGRYKTEVEAAIAYNKAVLILKEKNINKNYPLNYIEGLDEIGYASLLHKVRISNRIRQYEEK